MATVAGAGAPSAPGPATDERRPQIAVVDDDSGFAGYLRCEQTMRRPASYAYRPVSVFSVVAVLQQLRDVSRIIALTTTIASRNHDHTEWRMAGCEWLLDMRTSVAPFAGFAPKMPRPPAPAPPTGRTAMNTSDGYVQANRIG